MNITKRRPPCSDCGKAKRAPWSFSYCVKCANAHAVASQNRIIRYRKCGGCGKRYGVKAKNITQARIAGCHTRFCSVACKNDADRIYAINDRGVEYCRAPVPGGCDRIRITKGANGTYCAFCGAHDKRVQRGGRIDTPIVNTGQRYYTSKAAL